jgi:hypothetical protein
MVCCNASCGICTPPGGTCTEIACADDGGMPHFCGGKVPPGVDNTCEPTEFCDYDPAAMCGATDATGICAPRPMGCPDLFDPVCGCDGRDYSNSCDANAAGTDVAYAGMCGAPDPCAPQDAHGVGTCAAFFGYHWDGTSCYGVSGCSCDGADCSASWDSPEACAAAHSSCGTGVGCGARLGDTCTPRQFCDFPDDLCGAADVPGTCQPRPDVCDTVIDPVCGCDGVTYNNQCEAAGAGIDIASHGSCDAPPPPPPMDCRMTGCPPGQYCSLCFTRYACLPEGAVC